MPESCTSTCESQPKTHKSKCPACYQLAHSVSTRTMMQHLKEVWRYTFSNDDYYFCRTSECEVVYFTESGERLSKADVRTRIGIKEKDDNALTCYCFGITKAIATTNKEAKDFVINQTRESTCSCETANPSGQCCLKEFPKFA